MRHQPHSETSYGRWFLQVFVQPETGDWVDQRVETKEEEEEAGNQPGEITALFICYLFLTA